jgi:hypothetical protein
MKKIFTLVTLIATGFLFAQSADRDLAASGGSAQMIRAASSATGLGVAFYHTNPSREVDGKTHLFEEWENTAVIHTNDNQKFKVRNINLNLQRNSFESKFAKDSLFSFSFNNIKKIVINNRIYTNYYWDDDNKVYEVIFDNGEFQLLKGFKLVYIEGSANPMLNRARDKYIRREFIFLRLNEEIKPFKLKKNKVLKLMDAYQSNSDKIEAYAKNNRLSFKKP